MFELNDEELKKIEDLRNFTKIKPIKYLYVLKNHIKEAVNNGFSFIDIEQILKEKFDLEIKYHTLVRWIHIEIKNKEENETDIKPVEKSILVTKSIKPIEKKDTDTIKTDAEHEETIEGVLSSFNGIIDTVNKNKDFNKKGKV